MFRRFRSGLVAVLLFGTAGCDFPRDTEGTLDRVRGGTLRVGVVENPPWVEPGGDAPAGIEPALLAGFAAALNARIEWVRGSESRLVDALRHRRIDVLAAGLSADSPWASHVAFTQPWWGGTHVMAVAPGESALLLALDRHLAGREHDIAQHLGALPR